MKTRVMIQKRTPKYFHSDGNGVHLELEKTYKIQLGEKILHIRVIKEYIDFYLVMVEEGGYKMTVNKYTNDFLIIKWPLIYCFSMEGIWRNIKVSLYIFLLLFHYL